MLTLLSLWLSGISAAHADSLLVAVASNFAAPAGEVAAAFESETGQVTSLSIGATGQLYAQISQGAPFDVLLAADQERPSLAAQNGLAIADSQRTYALGKLALFSAVLEPVSGPSILMSDRVRRIAIANPETAPFGVAAMEVLAKWDLLDNRAFMIVRGANVGQAFQFAATRNADVGLISVSHAMTSRNGSYWVIPSELHKPIAQDAVVLTRSKLIAAAQAFLVFLGEPQSQAIIQKYGYGLPGSG